MCWMDEFVIASEDPKKYLELEIEKTRSNIETNESNYPLSYAKPYSHTLEYENDLIYLQECEIHLYDLKNEDRDFDQPSIL